MLCILNYISFIFFFFFSNFIYKKMSKGQRNYAIIKIGVFSVYHLHIWINVQETFLFNFLWFLIITKFEQRNKYIENRLQNSFLVYLFKSFMFFINCFISRFLKVFTWINGNGYNVCIINIFNIIKSNFFSSCLFWTLNFCQKYLIDLIFLIFLIKP